VIIPKYVQLLAYGMFGHQRSDLVDPSPELSGSLLLHLVLNNVFDFAINNHKEKNQLDGAESLGCRQVHSYSRSSLHFIEPEGSLPHSQEPTTCPDPEPDEPCLCSHATS
jgi:hypothetical protein